MSQRKRLRVAASDCLPSFLPAEGIPMASREEVVRKRPASARWEKPMKQGKPIKKNGKPSRSGTPGWAKFNERRKVVHAEEKKVRIEARAMMFPNLTSVWGRTALRTNLTSLFPNLTSVWGRTALRTGLTSLIKVWANQLTVVL